MASYRRGAILHAAHHARRLAELGDRQIAGENVLGELDEEWEQVLVARSRAVAAAAEDDDAARVVSDMADPDLLIGYRLGPQERLEWLAAALDAARRLGDRVAELQHYRKMGRAHAEQGDHARAGEHHARALAIATEAGVDVMRAEELDYLAASLDGRGEHALARQLHEQAVELFRELGNRDGEAASLANLGKHLWSRGELQNAREHFERSYEILSEVSPHKAPQAMGHLAGILAQEGECERALELAQRAVDSAAGFTDRQGHVRQLIGRAGVERLCGQLELARESFESARRLAVELGDRGAEYWALEWLAIVDAELGNLESSLAIRAQRVEMARAGGVARIEHAALVELGDACLAAGRVEEARTAFQRSRDLAALRLSASDGGPWHIDSNELRLAQATALERLGDMAAREGRFDAAIEAFGAAVDLLEAHPLSHLHDAPLTKLGHALADSGRADAAIATYERRLALVRKLGDRKAEADTIGEIANVLTARGEYGRAIENYADALAIDREIGSREDELAVLNNVAEPLRRLGRLEEAVRALEAAIAVADELELPQHAANARHRLEELLRSPHHDRNPAHG